MKRILSLLVVPVLMMILAIPGLAQTNLPYTTDLTINSGEITSDIGDLTVYSNGIVIFQIDEFVTDWRLAETQLYVSDEPPLKSKPDKFPYKHTGLGGTATDVYNIDLYAADLNGDGIVYIAARAGVTRQIGIKKNGKLITADETAWAQGDEFTGQGNNRIMFFTVTTSPVG